MSLTTFCAVLGLACFVCPLQAQETVVLTDGPTSSDLEKFIFIYEVEREELKKPILDLQAKYAAALDRLTLDAQEAGQLDRMLAVKNEREGFTIGRFSKDEEFSQLLHLRGVYQRELAKLLISANSEEAKLKKELLQGFENLKVELTKSGQLEEAVKIAEVIVRIESSRTIEEEITLGKSLFLLKNPTDQVDLSGCLVEANDGLFLVSMAAGQNIGKVTTKDLYSPPFVVTWDVSTDGGNIRMYYAQLFIIFNHESGRDTLQITDPELGRQHQRMIPELGRISANEFHEIKLVVEEDRYAFVVNGEVRAEGEGNYKDLSSAVSIGPAFGSHLRLRHFEIHR